MVHKIEVVPYNPDWPQLFIEEASKIKEALEDNCVAVHHIGSTAVLGLCAKPKIDIIAVVNERTFVIQVLEILGYQYRGEFNIPFRLGFTKRGSFPEINLHVFEKGNPEIELNLLFRDFLRHHPQARKAYANLKLELIKQEAHNARENTGFSRYNLGKDAFIKRILDQTGFKGLCIRRCTHYEEWEAARNFRQKYFFDKVPVSDPYTWTFDHKDHVHLILYRGTEIIGYAHIQLWLDHRAALRIIVIDKRSRNQGLGGQFLTLCEHWLKQQGYKVLQTQSSPKACQFYCKYSYSEMPFNDPDKYESDPRDTDMGKML